MNENSSTRKIAASALLAVVVGLAVANLRLTGIVKVQIVIAPDGRVKETKIIGGHPLLVNSVEETLKNWKYAPASSETTAQLEFNFHP